VKGKDGEGLKENGNISFHLEGEIENERWGIDRNGRQSQREKKISLREKRGRGGTGNERREISVLARGLCLMLERKSERDREKDRERKRPENWRRHRDRGGGLNWNGTTSFRREELFERRASLVSLEQYNCLERGLWSVMERVTMRKEKDRDRKREQEKERARWEWERQTKRPQRIENGTTSLWSGDSFLWARETEKDRESGDRTPQFSQSHRLEENALEVDTALFWTERVLVRALFCLSQWDERQRDLRELDKTMPRQYWIETEPLEGREKKKTDKTELHNSLRSRWRQEQSLLLQKERRKLLSSFIQKVRLEENGSSIVLSRERVLVRALFCLREIERDRERGRKRWER
jgi:hypothetical protein